MKWQPTPVLLPGKFHGRRSLVGYSPWGRKESDTSERLHFHFPSVKEEAWLAGWEIKTWKFQTLCSHHSRDGRGIGERSAGLLGEEKEACPNIYGPGTRVQRWTYIPYCCCCSVAQLYQTLCEPMDCSMPGSQSVTITQSLLKLVSTDWVGDAIQPSHSLSPPSLSALNLSQHWSIFQRMLHIYLF